MSNPDLNNYAQRAADELEAAALAQSHEAKRAHLDQAAIFAALDEQSRREQLSDGAEDVG